MKVFSFPRRTTACFSFFFFLFSFPFSDLIVATREVVYFSRIMGNEMKNCFFRENISRKNHQLLLTEFSSLPLSGKDLKAYFESKFFSVPLG